MSHARENVKATLKGRVNKSYAVIFQAFQDMFNKKLSVSEIHEAHTRIAPHVHRTPVMTSETFDRLSGKNIISFGLISG